MRVLALVLIAACSTSSAPPALETAEGLEITTLACMIPAGTKTNGIVWPVTFSGANKCYEVLTQFLNSHPERRIASVMSVDYPIKDPTAERTIGTQDLIVVHAEKGPWPKAWDLNVMPAECWLEGSLKPHSCHDALDKLKLTVAKAVHLVPLNVRRDAEHDGTRTVLIVYRFR